MDNTTDFSPYSLSDLYEWAENLAAEEETEEYAVLMQEIERREAMGKPYSPRGGSILTLGIVGLIFSIYCGLPGIVVAGTACYMANSALKEMQATHYTERLERSLVLVGRGCAVLGIVVYVVAWLGIGVAAWRSR